MSLPKQLVKIATMGTENSPSTHVDSLSSVVNLIRERNHRNAQRQVLATVAGFTFQRLAGWIPPVTTEKLDAPSEADTKKVCNRAALEHLIVMLKGQFQPLLPLWLKAVADRGQRVPEETLPLLLEAGRRNPNLQDLIVPILGARGDWLGETATSNEWDWFKPRDVMAQWEQGTRGDRIQLIEILRKTDPVLARLLVEETWGSESYVTRLRLLATFELGLSNADEPFLERALDDRSLPVRRDAIRLLLRLPESDFRRRALERARSCLYFDRDGLQPVVRVRFPTDYDDIMKRDMIRNDSEQARLASIVSYVDPVFWCEAWGISSEDLFEGIRHNKQQAQVLWGALNDAIFFTHSTPMAEALFVYWLETFQSVQNSEWLTNLLSSEGLERCALRLLTHPQHRLSHNVLRFLDKLDSPWSEALASSVIEGLEHYLLQLGSTRNFPLRDRIQRYAMYIPESMGEAYLSVWKTEEHLSQVTRREIQKTFDFRRRMWAALNNQA